MIPIPLARPGRACYSACVKGRAALASLVITVAFVGARWGIYATHSVAIPCSADPGCAAWARAQPEPEKAFAEPALDEAAWVRRDVLMTWPRLAAFVLCLAAMAAFGGLSRWKWRGLTPSFVLIAACSCGFVMKHGYFGPPGLGRPHALWMLWANVFVVLWEEACYRGLLYLGLRERFEPVPAALISSAAFTLMHVQAQPVSLWFWIFCVGIAACASLEGGTGLLWLMLAHWAVDSVPYLVDGKEWWGATSLLGSFLCVAAAACSLIRLSGSGKRTAEA
jgi:membrane protease YdiL (CAAX protease family)